MLKKKCRVFYGIFLAFIMICGGYNICLGQDEEKGIQSEELVKNRPFAKLSGTAAISNKKPGTSGKTKQKKSYYKVVKSAGKKTTTKPVKKPSIQVEDALLGFTVWKIRPATKDDAAKELVEEERDGKTQNSEYTLERLLTESPLQIGERIRLSIESLSHSGYLYIVERELYSDGSYSNPKLIYPTLRSRYKASPISAGRLIFVPEGTRHFRITSTQTARKQVAEVLTIVVSPKMLIETSSLQTKAIDLPGEVFSGWLNQWEVDTTMLEQIDGAGQTITLVEQSAGLDAAKGLSEESSVLTQDDAVPQSIFRGKIKKGNPFLVNVYLNFSSN